PNARRPRQAAVLRRRSHQHRRPRQLRGADARGAAVLPQRGGYDEQPRLPLCALSHWSFSMTLARCSRREALAILLGSCALATAHGAALPVNSVYQLDVPLTDHRGHEFRWPELRGRPLLVSMFYTSCDMVCPMIFETIALTLAKAGAAGQGTKVLMVSFDPARDTVPVLQKAAAAHRFDERWTLARADVAT